MQKKQLQRRFFFNRSLRANGHLSWPWASIALLDRIKPGSNCDCNYDFSVITIIIVITSVIMMKVTIAVVIVVVITIICDHNYKN